MTEAASSDKHGAQDAPGVRQWRSAIPAVPSVLVLALGVMVVLTFRFGPILLWAHNLERAGRLMDVGLVWPEQRLVDSLPTSRDEAALEAALGSLGSAMRWRPDHPYAYRLAGQVYTARREWLKAAEAFESARRLAPGNPLLAWENSLVYEQMSRIVQTASRETILPDLASAPIDVPHMRVDTKLCREGQPRTCYVGLTTFMQPLADLPDGPQVAADVLFMHPPARVNLSHPLYVDHAVLHFLFGLDPGARERGTDGATFQVWVKPATTQPVLLYERTVDRMTATRGWVPGSADLSRWVGQTVTLVLSTTGGPANSTAGDWYGWGDVTLTTREAAQYALVVPEVRMRQAWHSAGFQAAQFLERGRRPANEGRHAEALVWYERAAMLDPNWGEPWYQMAAVYRAQGAENKAQETWEKAVQLYEQAAQGSPDNRDGWYRLGQLYGERQLWAEALHAYQQGTRASIGQTGLSNFYFRIGHIRQFSLSPPDLAGAWASYQQALTNDTFADETWKADTHHLSGVILASQKRWEEAILEFQRALALDQSDPAFYLSLADALWKVGRREPAKANVQEAIERNPQAKDAYYLLADFYRMEGNLAAARAVYTKVIELDPADSTARKALEKIGNK